MAFSTAGIKRSRRKEDREEDNAAALPPESAVAEGGELRGRPIGLGFWEGRCRVGEGRVLQMKKGWGYPYSFN